MYLNSCVAQLNRPGGILCLLVARSSIRFLSDYSLNKRSHVRAADPRQRPSSSRGFRAQGIYCAGEPEQVLQKPPGSTVPDASSRSQPDSGPTSTMRFRTSTPEEMQDTGAYFGADSRAGDVVLLWGDLGTGKTCFARGFVRAVVGDPDLVVTSPSYLLDNTYYVEQDDLTVHHMDLHRLRGECDLDILDLSKVLETGISLVEWPDRLGVALPLKRLDVRLEATNEGERAVTLTGYGNWWAGAVDDFKDSRRQKAT